MLPTSGGTLVETPFVDYLEWRRSLDPSRFDLNHPNIATELGQFVPPAVSVPSGDTTGGGTTHPFNPTPQNLPEPGTFWIALTLIGLEASRRAEPDLGPRAAKPASVTPRRIAKSAEASGRAQDKGSQAGGQDPEFPIGVPRDSTSNSVTGPRLGPLRVHPTRGTPASALWTLRSSC